MAIGDCTFNLTDYETYDSRTNTSSSSYYYKIPISSKDSDLIIRYSGNNNNGIFKEAGSYRSFIEKINMVDSKTAITIFENSNN